MEPFFEALKAFMETNSAINSATCVEFNLGRNGLMIAAALGKRISRLSEKVDFVSNDAVPIGEFRVFVCLRGERIQLPCKFMVH